MSLDNGLVECSFLDMYATNILMLTCLYVNKTINKQKNLLTKKSFFRSSDFRANDGDVNIFKDMFECFASFILNMYI